MCVAASESLSSVITLFRSALQLITERAAPQKVHGVHYMGPSAGEVMQGFAVALRSVTLGRPRGKVLFYNLLRVLVWLFRYLGS